ncbi:MAG: peptidylprolyl isomerase [Candidatus Eremiobacteraeota bacterium]|nr:peptidylprolyl isomerase [Candidatus Eremiobacteraeota bacterium]
MLAFCALAAPGPSNQQLLQLERARSLGDGALAGMLDGPDRTLAIRAALAIGRTKDARGAAVLLRHVHDRNPAMRAMAVYGLGLLAVPRSQDAVLAAAGDGSSAVRYAAVDAIGRLETAGRFDATHEPVAARLLETMIAPQPGNALEKDAIVRAHAAANTEAFRKGQQGFGMSEALVRAFDAERNDDVRWHLMWAIFRGYRLRVPRAVLLNALHDPNELVRIGAVRACGGLTDDRGKPAADVIPSLEPLTHDPSWRVQEQAFEAIRALSGKPPTDHLTELPPGLNLPPPKTLPPIAALPRPSVTGSPAAPAVSEARFRPRLDPASAAAMDGPMPGLHPRVRIGTTKGDFIVVLYPEWAPLTVANFLNLTNRGYFDGLRWFRIVPDFVVQTGDPHDNGEGDAGYSIPAEENPVEQRSYVISMGLNYNDAGPERDSAGTQFYITLSPQLHLDRDFTVFGEVTGGTEVLAHLIETDRMTKVEQLPDVMLR